MTVDSIPAQKSSRILKGTNALLLLLSVILLIAGFPSFLFGVFLAISQRPGGNVEYISPTLGGDIAFGFSFAGLVAVLCSLGIRAYLRRRDGGF